MNISGPAAVAKPEMLFYAPGDLTVTTYLNYTKKTLNEAYLRDGVKNTILGQMQKVELK